MARSERVWAEIAKSAEKAASRAKLGGVELPEACFGLIWLALRSLAALIRYMAVPSGPWLALVALRAPVLSLCAPLSSCLRHSSFGLALH